MDGVPTRSAVTEASPVLAVGEYVERHCFIEMEGACGHPATSGLCQAYTLGYHLNYVCLAFYLF
jgi:hypothetical protein